MVTNTHFAEIGLMRLWTESRVISLFVKKKQITGKPFLRLNEGDLAGYEFFFFLVLLFLFLVLFLPSANNWFESEI